MKYTTLLFSILLSTLLFVSACKDDTPDAPKGNGRISFQFSHKVNGEALQKDRMKYTNQAGNLYEINQLMYFISDVTLHKSDGTSQLIDDWDDTHYIDIDMPETLIWNVYDDIEAGNYDSISFTFGLDAAKNQSFRFVNPPESFMAWPDVLGGGYHYMMLNGKWKTPDQSIENLACHLGIGQLYKNNIIEIDSIIGFVHNNFHVKLPASAFSMEENKTRTIEIVMDIDSWFTSPNTYNFDYWGGSIMQNQAAMQKLKENGADVFSIGSIK